MFLDTSWVPRRIAPWPEKSRVMPSLLRKGVPKLTSPNYTWAMGIKMFKLECPIGLQLACMGSKSTINYGAHSSIAFGTKCVDEYFDVANIDHYNVILGTPFLRRLGITLDFSGQGVIHLGAHEVSRNLPLTPVNEKSNA